MRGKQTKGDVPDEQFANLLGGEILCYYEIISLLFNHNSHSLN